jgi:hypothetical protein
VVATEGLTGQIGHRHSPLSRGKEGLHYFKQGLEMLGMAGENLCKNFQTSTVSHIYYPSFQLKRQWLHLKRGSLKAFSKYEKEGFLSYIQRTPNSQST